jgi:hypothetical protein
MKVQGKASAWAATLWHAMCFCRRMDINDVLQNELPSAKNAAIVSKAVYASPMIVQVIGCQCK